MGADGGINWVYTTDVSKFTELVRPLGLMWDTGDYYDSYHLDWMEKNPVPGNIVSRYGSFCRRQGMDELSELLYYLEFYFDGPCHEWDYYWQHTGTNPLDLTWEELLTDYYSHPLIADLPKYMIPPPVALMVEDFGIFYDKARMALGREPAFLQSPLFQTPLRTWFQELTAIINRTSFGSAETWT